MKKEHKDTIINMVNEIGISNTLDIIGGDKDIIRKVYIDYPESYLDYLIGKLHPMKDTYGINRWVYEYKVNKKVKKIALLIGRNSRICRRTLMTLL